MMLEDWSALPCLVIWNRPSFDIHVIPACAGIQWIIGGFPYTD